MSSCIITKDSLDNLSYDMSTKNVSFSLPNQSYVTPSVQVVFKNADLNAAAYHLGESLKNPFAPNAIVTLLVEESVREDFLNKIKSHLETPLPSEIANFRNRVEALKKIEQMHLVAITNGSPNASNCPVLVCDTTHEYLFDGATGVITVHTFRTAKEAIALCGKESVKFTNATIWNENHSCAYELVAALPCSNFNVNCHLVPLEPLTEYIKSKQSFATIIKNYHYETLTVNGAQKTVVFPVGTIFAN